MDSRYQPMKQVYDRRELMCQFMQPFMEEKFDESCQKIRTELEKHGSEEWSELKSIIQRIAEDALSLQERGKKGNIKYLVFSFMLRSSYMESPELRIDMLDEGFYLDEREAAGYYFPGFLQEKYRQDLKYLYHKMGSKFVRIQKHERTAISEAYIEFYNDFLYRMIENLKELLVKTVRESGIGMACGFEILYGEYMGWAEALYMEEGE